MKTNATPFTPETCPPMSAAYCEWIDRHDPDPPAVEMTPYEWCAVLDVIQTAIEGQQLHTKAAAWAQLILHRLRAGLFPAAMVAELAMMTRCRAEKN